RGRENGRTLANHGSWLFRRDIGRLVRCGLGFGGEIDRDPPEELSPIDIIAIHARACAGYNREQITSAGCCEWQDIGHFIDARSDFSELVEVERRRQGSWILNRLRVESQCEVGKFRIAAKRDIANESVARTMRALARAARWRAGGSAAGAASNLPAA